ncbi:unnamed protein product [Miscanthus lutarioriparius]|uniref:Uncharacterized protein n=1 Tax=Miscanthus lutarioriparius TaxID=422564 RepID=A0A811QDK5_9POAL|nr:unnamed protein product [Miscanthus lutarioriparius]
MERKLCPTSPRTLRHPMKKWMSRRQIGKGRIRARQAWHNHAQHRKEEWQWYQLACRDIERRHLAAEAAYEQLLRDEEAERQCQYHDAVRASTSRNLELEFMEVAGHRVFTTPYANVYALVEVMAAIENPTLDQQ